MAWNGSDQTSSGAASRRTRGEATSQSLQRSSPKKSPKSSPRSPLRLLTPILLLLALAGAAVWYFTRPADAKSVRVQKKAKPSAIAETKPAVVTNKSAAKAEKPKPEPEKPKIVTNFVNGVWYDPEGRPHYQPARTIVVGSKTIINGKPYVPPRSLFTHPSEVELDRILSCKPGDRIIGETNWKLFERDFPSALVDSISIDPEDTEEEIARKEAVKAAKSTLAKAIKNGEDPVAIMKEAQQDMNRMADLYDSLNVEIAAAKKTGEMSEDDLELYVEAANKMLEKNKILDKKILSPKAIRDRIEAARAFSEPR